MTSFCGDNPEDGGYRNPARSAAPNSNSPQWGLSNDHDLKTVPPKTTHNKKALFEDAEFFNCPGSALRYEEPSA